MECHGAKKQKAELRLDARTFALKGGENGAVFVPGEKCGEQDHRARDEHRSRRGDAVERRAAVRRADRRATRVGRRGRGVAGDGRGSDRCARYAAGSLGMAPARRKSGTRNPEIRNSIDAFIDAKLAEKGLRRSPGGGCAHALPPVVFRSHRPAADAGGDGAVRQSSHGKSPRAYRHASWTHSSPPRTTASAGRGTGSTSRITRTRTASSAISGATTRGATAIG